MARYLGDRRSYTVHDLRNEQARCETNLIDIEHREWFEELRDAQIAGYHDCQWCLKLEVVR